MLSTISTPILIILSVVIGLLIGLLISTFFSRESKTTGENPIPEKYTKQGYAESARLLYSPATKKTITYLDGDYYDDYIALTPDQKKRVLRLIGTWSEWGGVASKPQETAVPEDFHQATAKPDTATAFQTTGPTTNIPPLPQMEREPSIVASEPETLESLGINVPKPIEPIPAVVSFTIGQPKKIAEKPKSFVDQINEKLKEILNSSPNETRSIQLTDDGNQGVIVWVGNEHFDGVDKVPYDEVQEYIKMAVARWENESMAQKKN